MRKVSILTILLLLAGMYVSAQKKSGTVFIEHEAIDKTRSLWKASVEGDLEKFRSFFADSAIITTNGNQAKKQANAMLGKGLDKWAGSYDNLKIGDHKPAYPDAIEYKEGGTWVQDWLLLTGTHRETGINLNLPVHCLYAFNDDGKITFMIRYFDNNVFEEIQNSKGKKKNGTVYINHPYILNTRKAMNAFVAGDVEEWKKYYAPDARISTLAADFGESWSFDEHAAAMKQMFFKDGFKFRVEQVGYPDCIYYEKNQMYVVYSWWKFIAKTKGGEPYEFGFMISQDYNDEGKIVREHIYSSSNHTDKL